MDKILLKKALMGDGNAFINLFKRYEKKLYLVAKSRLNNEEDIKDVLQETLYQSYKNLSQLKDYEKFGSWVMRILINNCNNMLRDKNYYNLSYEKINCDNSDTDTESLSPYVEIDNKLDYFNIIENLKQDDRTIMSLYYNGYTSHEISKLLEMNENTVRTKIKRIRDKIIKKYGKER